MKEPFYFDSIDEETLQAMLDAIGLSGHNLDPFVLQQQQAHAMYKLHFEKTSNAEDNNKSTNEFASDFQAMYIGLPPADLEREPQINFNLNNLLPTSDDKAIIVAPELLPLMFALPPREITRCRIHRVQARLKEAIQIAFKPLGYHPHPSVDNTDLQDLSPNARTLMMRNSKSSFRETMRSLIQRFH
jgi:hypothetical protein